MPKKNEISVAFLGSAGVGKSSIIGRFINGTFAPDMQTTTGAGYFRKNIPCQNPKNYTLLKIWDTAGQERFRSIIPMYYRACQIIVLTYDMTSRDSFTDLTNYWLPTVQALENKRIVVAGNKSDLGDKIAVDASEFCSSNNISHFNVSALNGSGVAELFEQIVNDFVAQTSESGVSEGELIVKGYDKKSCC